MESDSSNDELLCPSDNETPHLSTSGTKSRKFDEKQTATLTTYILQHWHERSGKGFFLQH